MSITYLGVEQLKGYDDKNWTEGIETFDFTLSDKSNKCYSYHGPVIRTTAEAKLINNSHTLKLTIPFNSDINYYQKVALELPIIVESDAKLSIHINNKTVPVSTRIISSEHVINTIFLQGPTKASQNGESVTKETLNTICFEVTDEFESFKHKDIDLVLYIDYGPDSQNQLTGVKILLQDIEISSMAGKKKLPSLGFSLSQSNLGWLKLILFSLLFFALVSGIALVLLKFTGLLEESPGLSLFSSVVAGLSLLFRVKKDVTFKPTVQQAFKYSYLKWQQWGVGYIAILLIILGLCAWQLYKPFYCIYTEYSYKSEIKDFIEKGDKNSLYSAFKRSPWRREAPILLSQMIYKELDLFHKREMKSKDLFNTVIRSIKPGVTKLQDDMFFGCDCLDKKNYVNQEEYHPLMWYSLILYDIASGYDKNWKNSGAFLDTISTAIFFLDNVVDNKLADLLKLGLQTKIANSFQKPILMSSLQRGLKDIYRTNPDISSQYYLFIIDFLIDGHANEIKEFANNITNNLDDLAHKLNEKRKKINIPKYRMDESFINELLDIQKNINNSPRTIKNLSYHIDIMMLIINNYNKKNSIISNENGTKLKSRWFHSPKNLFSFNFFTNNDSFMHKLKKDQKNKTHIISLKALKCLYTQIHCDKNIFIKSLSIDFKEKWEREVEDHINKNLNLIKNLDNEKKTIKKIYNDIHNDTISKIGKNANLEFPFYMIKKEIDDYFNNKKNKATDEKYLKSLKAIEQKDYIYLADEKKWLENTILSNHINDDNIYAYLNFGWSRKL